MLKTLSIRNVVLIEKLDIDFSDRLCVFSGETGAGKSILLDSLGLLLGQRADTGLIRNGADKLSVSGIFELKDKNNPIFALCLENDIDLENEIIIKRSLNCDGKSKIFINDQPITVRLLKEIGSYLVEVHGQFDNQGLLNPSTHLNVLDSYGSYQKQLDELQTAFKNYKETQNKLRQAEQAFADASRDEENLRHWVDELQKANIQPDEETQLNNKRTEFIHAEKLIENLNLAYTLLRGKDIGSSLQKAQSAIEQVNRLTNNRCQDIADALDTALIQFDEAVGRIEQASSEICLNSNEAEQVEERLFALRALARKHQTDIAGLPDILNSFEQKLHALDKGGDDILSLQKALAISRQEYLKKAQIVHNLRQDTAAKLDKAVMCELPPLKMERAVFSTNITSTPENLWNEKGCDNVCFTVATNPNSTQGALNKIASGGELARFMLALKVNLAQRSSVETLIFDEVDAGIGGATAEAVGERLARLGTSVQVLVVTHAPQVAAFGKQNFKVSKSTKDDITTTNVAQLNLEEKKEEIARMLAGETITEQARAAAEALIKQQPSIK